MILLSTSSTLASQAAATPTGSRNAIDRTIQFFCGTRHSYFSACQIMRLLLPIFKAPRPCLRSVRAHRRPALSSCATPATNGLRIVNNGRHAANIATGKHQIQRQVGVFHPHGVRCIVFIDEQHAHVGGQRAHKHQAAPLLLVGCRKVYGEIVARAIISFDNPCVFRKRCIETAVRALGLLRWRATGQQTASCQQQAELASPVRSFLCSPVDA